MNTTKHELRDDDGRYAVGLDRMCRCGHRKGSHLAGEGRSAGGCIAHEVGDAEEPCSCEKFRASR